MQPIQFFAARAEDGALLPDATVDVFVHGTQDRAILFSDSAGTVPLSNPFRADANARVFFYSTDNRIDIRISRYGYVAPMVVDITTLDVATAVEQVRAEIDQALGEIGDALDHMEQEFDELLLNSGFETAFVAYSEGAVVARKTQLVQRNSELYRVKDQADLPLTLTGDWAVDEVKLVAMGDAALRQQLMSPDGSKNVRTQLPGANTVARKLHDKFQREIELADYVSGGIDDTVQFENMCADIENKTTKRLITFGALSSYYAATTPRVIIRRGDYTISKGIDPTAYFECEGEKSIITQMNPELDHFVGEGYQWNVSGLILVGGRHNFSMHNANSDGALLQFEHNEHHLSSSKPFHTFSTHPDFDHLSTNLSVRDSRILVCNGVINNVCDSALFDNVFVRMDKANFDPNGGAFVNDGGATGRARLLLRGLFGVPTMGEGLDRVPNARWIDNWGSVESIQSRFGGEEAGMSVVWHHRPANTVYPFLGSIIDIQGGEAFCGPANRSDSGLVVLDGHVPQGIIIKGVHGPADVPYVVNPSAFSIPAYMAAWEAATGQKAYNYFYVDIKQPFNANPDGSIGYGRMPADLRPYLASVKRVSLARNASQSIPNGFVLTPVQFDTVVEDNVGGFTLASPTLLTMPQGCTRMVIVINGSMQTNGAAKTIAAVLINNSSATVGGATELKGINPDNDRFNVTFIVKGTPGTSWNFCIRHNGAAALNLQSCSADILPLDFV
ncbi:hypothetical protein [Pseudomonas brassicacearum]|uniref:hypothetical protein n=1 Tax=Pseudomonas brassicacearum TaxID=930166 RepID=UPI003D6C31A1